MRIILLESPTQTSLAPALAAAGHPCECLPTLTGVTLDPSADEPLLFVLNHPAAADLPRIAHECAHLTPGKPFHTLAIVDRSDEATIQAALDAGIHDLLCMPFAPAEMALRVRNAQMVVQYTRKALYDSLSGLLNHGAIADLLQRELQRARRTDSTVAVAMCDIDLFKQVNDNYGHQAGDAAIKAVASRLQSQVRPYDYVARYGGDEFLIVLVSCTPMQAQDICERMRQAIATVAVETSAGEIHIQMSLGLAVIDPTNEMDVSRIIHLADIALYEAKKSGRNRVILARQMP